MARLITTGFEIPDYWSPFDYGDVTGVYFSTSSPRSGSYCARFTTPTLGGDHWNRYAQIPGSPAELYLRFAARGDNNAYYMKLTDNANTMLVGVSFGVSAAITLTCNGQTITSTYIYPSEDTWVLIEVHAKLGTADGYVELKVNGVSEGSYTGDTIPGSQTGYDRMHIGNWSAGAHHHDIDDLAVNDTTGSIDNTWCGDGHIIAIRPESDNDVIQWTPNTGYNFAAVDEADPDEDTTYVWTDTVDDVDKYNLFNPSLPSNAVIRRVWVESVARKTDAGAIDYLNLGVQSGTTEAWSDDIELGTVYTKQKGPEYNTDPNTSGSWTRDAVNALKVMIRAS